MSPAVAGNVWCLLPHRWAAWDAQHMQNILQLLWDVRCPPAVCFCGLVNALQDILHQRKVVLLKSLLKLANQPQLVCVPLCKDYTCTW